MKLKLNFNTKSVKAWVTLVSAIGTAILSILAALGVTVNPNDANTLATLLTTLFSLLATAGVLYAPTDAPKQDSEVHFDEPKK